MGAGLAALVIDFGEKLNRPSDAHHHLKVTLFIGRLLLASNHSINGPLRYGGLLYIEKLGVLAERILDQLRLNLITDLLRDLVLGALGHDEEHHRRAMDSGGKDQGELRELILRHALLTHCLGGLTDIPRGEALTRAHGEYVTALLLCQPVLIKSVEELLLVLGEDTLSRSGVVVVDIDRTDKLEISSHVVQMPWL